MKSPHLSSRSLCSIKGFCMQCLIPTYGRRMTRVRGLRLGETKRLVEGPKMRLKSPDTNPGTLPISTVIEKGRARALPPIGCVHVLGQVTFLSMK